jgi:hypothetical protein
VKSRSSPSTGSNPDATDATMPVIHTPLPIYWKLLLCALWLAAAYWSQSHRAARICFALAGGVIAGAHLLALAGVGIQYLLKPSMIPYIGIQVGGSTGALVGLAAGFMALKLLWVYWPIQILAVVLLLVAPLVDW